MWTSDWIKWETKYYWGVSFNYATFNFPVHESLMKVLMFTYLQRVSNLCQWKAVMIWQFKILKMCKVYHSVLATNTFIHKKLVWIDPVPWMKQSFVLLTCCPFFRKSFHYQRSAFVKWVFMNEYLELYLFHSTNLIVKWRSGKKHVLTASVYVIHLDYTREYPLLCAHRISFLSSSCVALV